MRLTKPLRNITILLSLLAIPFYSGCRKHHSSITIQDNLFFNDSKVDLKEDIIHNAGVDFLSLKEGAVQPFVIQGANEVAFIDQSYSKTNSLIDINSMKVIGAFPFDSETTILKLVKLDKHYLVIVKCSDNSISMQEYDENYTVLRQKDLSLYGIDEFADLDISSGGVIYLSGRNQIVRLDDNWELVDEFIQKDIWISSVCCYGRDCLVSVMINNDGWCIQWLRNNLSQTDSLSIDAQSYIDEINLLGYLDQETLLIEMNLTLYLYHSGSGILSKHYAPASDDIYTTHNSFEVHNNSTYFVGMMPDNTWNYYSVNFSDNYRDIETIHISVDENLSSYEWVDYLVYEWNKKDNKCKVVLDSSDYSTSSEKIYSDLIIGNGADIYFVDESFLNRMISAEMCQNILPLLEMNPSFSEADFYEGPWNSMKTARGELLFLVPYFQVKALWGNPGLSDSKNLSWEDLLLLREEYAHILRHSRPITVFNNFWNSFVEEDLTHDSIKSYLEFCNTLSDEEYNETLPIANQIGEAQLAFIDESIGSFGYYIALSEYFADDPQAYCYPELPTPIAISDMFICVSQNSSNGDSVADFLQFMLSEESLLGINHDERMAIIRKSASQGETEKYYSAYLEGESIGSLGVNYMLLTDEQIEKSIQIDHHGSELNHIMPEGTRRNTHLRESLESYYSLLSNARFGFPKDNDLYDLIREEALAYFIGDKDLSDVSSLILSRVKQYISEKEMHS